MNNFLKQYFDLLEKNQFNEAENLRQKNIPLKLIKFISLTDDDELNNTKFETLSEQKIWFSSINKVNDPYEFKGMYIDTKKLKNNGYTDENICLITYLFELTKKFGITCLSANTFDNLPMWAYYTNNHKGFCVEYDVTNKECIYEIMYEPELLEITSILSNLYVEIQKNIINLNTNNEMLDYYTTLFKYQLFLKHKSWEHEKEYRIVYPMKYNQSNSGQAISISEVGLKTSKIIAGLYCKNEHIQKLNEISKELGCGEVKQTKTSDNKYILLE